MNTESMTMNTQNAPAEVGIDVQRLVRLSVVERIEAAERYYRQHDERFADGLRHAAEIAAPDGWQYLAPAWTKPNVESAHGERTTKY